MTVDEFVKSKVQPELRPIAAAIRSVMKESAPKASEAISYGIPMFKYNGMLVGYAAFKNHCSLFPTGSGVLDQFEKELRNYRTSKGTIQFPSDKPLPDALGALITQSVVGIIEQAERSLTGASVLWMGESRF